MGGNALASGSVRIGKLTHEELAYEITFTIQNDFRGSYANPVVSYLEKSDFGDLDIVTLNIEDTPRLRERLSDMFGASEFVRNGNVLSFGARWIRDFVLQTQKDIPGVCRYTGPAVQVDLVMADSPPEYEFARRYLGFNDLGNLIGRVASALGFKFGSKGLYYDFVEGTYLHKSVLVSDNFGDSLRFLGYKPTDHCTDNMKTLEDVFKYAASSKYFNPDIYLLQNRNAEARIRDRKRKTYMEFLKWCEENYHSIHNGFISPDKNLYLGQAFGYFTGFESRFRECTQSLLLKRAIKANFNGRIVHEITGLTGAELGKFMERFRLGYQDEALFERDACFRAEILHDKIRVAYEKSSANPGVPEMEKEVEAVIENAERLQ